MSWRLEANKERLNSRVVAAIVESVSLSKNQQLSFKEVHSMLVGRHLTMPTNQRKTSLYLKRLVEKGVLLQSVPRGPYSLKVNAKDFEMFSYLDWLKDQYGNRGLTRSFGVGGFTWRESSGMIVPFVGTPNKIDEYVLGELEKLLSSAFSALKDLRNTVLLQGSGFDAGYSQKVMRLCLVASVMNIILQEDISNYGVYLCLGGLTGKRRLAGKDTNEQISLKYFNRSLDRSMDFWKKVFYDINGESTYDSDENHWVHFARQGKESIPEVKEMVSRVKEDLKRTGFDVDRVSLSELRASRKELRDAVHKKLLSRKPKSTLFSGYTYSPKEQEFVSNLETSVGIKWIEAFLQREVDWEDFAVVLSTPPEVMERYNTTLHKLKGTVEYWEGLTQLDDELFRYFASEMLTDDLTLLQRPGVASIVGLTDDQLDKVIENWNKLRKKWEENAQRAEKEEDEIEVWDSTRPEVELSKEKEALLLADLKRTENEQ
jgi:hypothetical protein